MHLTARTEEEFVALELEATDRRAAYCPNAGPASRTRPLGVGHGRPVEWAGDTRP
ncbi:hypothetical protein [Streptomyces phaeochromogenes]|uniref:hypothetical protein n=1 Tax=Streptomyces phaeochromogenes TaxID=1923 RepID=UPI0033FB28BB